jgi:hypothetical protein
VSNTHYLLPPRYLLLGCVAHDLRHGFDHAQDGPCQGQVACQAPACFRGTYLILPLANLSLALSPLQAGLMVNSISQKNSQVTGGAKAGKWVLFVLPFITVLREGAFHSSSGYAHRMPMSLMNRYGGRCLRRRRLSRSTRSIHTDRRHCRHRLRPRLRIPHLRLCIARRSSCFPCRHDKLHPLDRCGTVQQSGVGLRGKRV